MSIDWGFDFRNTLAGPASFPGDPANCSFDNNINYPNVYGNGATAGWDYNITATVGFAADESVPSEGRLCGVCGNVNAPATKQTFRVDLPATGLYTITFAVGDFNYERTNQSWSMQDNGVAFSTLTGGDTVAALNYFDASQVVRTSAADWTSNNATITHTFTSTLFQLVIGDGTHFTLINHLRITGPAGATVAQLLPAFTQTGGSWGVRVV